MDGHTTDLRGDMYDVIFKTIYLFLETNEFYTTAKCFLAEIKSKYNRDVDRTLSNARTLVLRPYYDRADASTVCDTPYEGGEKASASPSACFDFDATFVVEQCVVDDDDDAGGRSKPSVDVYNRENVLESDVKVDVVLTAQSERTSAHRSQQTKEDAPAARESSSLLGEHPERLDSGGTIERIRRDLEYVNAMAVKEERLDRHDLSLLRESFLLLQTIQGNHVKLINLAKNLSSAILKLDLPSKDHLLTHYRKDIADLCSYGAPPPPPPTDGDDPTDYQIESSLINSSNASNHLLATTRRDAFIPLEGKPVVGDLTRSGDDGVVKLFAASAPSSGSNDDDGDLAARVPPPTMFRDERHRRRRRANKSATLPSVRVVSGAPTTTSRSASQLDEIASRDLEREYQDLAAVKTKLILEREKTRLEEEIKKINRVNKAVRTREKYKTTPTPTPTRDGDRDVVAAVAADVDQTRSEHQFALDWCALKKALFDDAPEVKMKLLQALRWRLLYSDERRRYAFLVDCVKNDVLSLNTVAPYGQLFLESFYCPKKTATPHPLQEEMSRFINTLASLAMGRFYLERDESLLSVMLLPLLMGRLPGVQISELTREFVMAAVQKLSLSNKMRECIIAAGAVEWLIAFIEQRHARLTAYEAEYSTALLTNLCINKAGRSRCERVADAVVAVIDELVVTPHRCCLPYVNPILYNLLLNPVINERAFARGIGARLKRLYIIYGDDDDLKRQLDAIVAMLERREFCDCDDAETEDVSCHNYADFLEQELGEDDPVYRTPFGEPLLEAFRLRDVAPSGASLRTFHQNDGKRPAIVQKNCNCNERYERRHRAAETHRSNRRGTSRAQRERAVAGAPCPKRDAASRKTKTRPNLRQRSFSQPPPAAGGGMMAAGRAQYVVNCCYQMDYVNAVTAPAGEFAPVAPRVADERAKACECYATMRGFLADVERTSSVDATVGRTPSGAAPSLFDMRHFTDDDDKVTSYGDADGAPRAPPPKSARDADAGSTIDVGAAILKLYDEPTLSNKR